LERPLVRRALELSNGSIVDVVRRGPDGAATDAEVAEAKAADAGVDRAEAGGGDEEA